MTSTMEREVPLQVRFLRLPEVQRRTGLSRSTIYVRLERGLFPRPVSLGGRAVGWIESEVDEWIRQRIAESRFEGDRHRERVEAAPRTLAASRRAAEAGTV